MTNRTSRLAPSTTGALHLGNVRTFLVNWAMARRSGWRLLMRLEDLDGPRNKPEAAEATLDVLSWLGLDWDGPPDIQSASLDPYVSALRSLAQRGLVYACDLSRNEIRQAAAAPHASDHETVFPAALRPADGERFQVGSLETNYRLVVPDEPVTVDDGFAGRREQRPAREVGDFVVWTRRGVPAYQLAVVVDDARQGVTDVVRGDDLLSSAARQQLIYRALELPPPRWWHTPLVIGHDGRRLAKRHGDTRVSSYREHGVLPERIIGLIASWTIPGADRAPMSAAEFLERFDPTTLPRDPIVLTGDDHAWLLQTTTTDRATRGV